MDSEDRGDKRGWRRLGARLRGSLRWVGPMLVVAVVVAGFGVIFANAAGRVAPSRTANGSATATASPSAAATVTPGNTPTTQATNTPATSSAGAQATPQATASDRPPPYPQIFQILSTTVTADPADNFKHTCAPVVEETFTITVTVAPNRPSGNVTYTWDDSFQNQFQGTLTFAPGETTKSVTIQIAFSAGKGDGSQQRASVMVEYQDPTSATWSLPDMLYTPASVAYTCVRQITSLTMTPSISSWDAPCGGTMPVTMTWTAIASPGPQITVIFSGITQSNPSFSVWLAPGAFGTILPATTGQETSSQVSRTISTYLSNSAGLPNGPYWMQIDMTSPATMSARGTVMKNC